MNKQDEKKLNSDEPAELQQQNQELLHPRARKNIPHPCSPNQTKSNNNDNNNISQSSDNDVIMGINFSEFDHQTNITAIRRNTPIPGQYNINLNSLSSSNSSVSGSGALNSADRARPPSSKVPSIPLSKARQSSPNSSGQIPNVKMNIDFNKFDNSGSSIRLPTPRPGQTIGPGGIPEEEYYKLANGYKNPEEEESGEADAENENEDYSNVRIDINQIPTEEEEVNIPNIVIDANNLNDNENNDEELPDVKVDIDFSKFDNQYHTNRFATPRPDKENGDDDDISLGEEEEEAADAEPNEMENIRIDVPLEFNNPADDDNNNDNADVSLNIDFSQFDIKNRPLTMSTPRPVVADEGIELEEEEDEKENTKPKNEVKRPIPSISNNNNANNKPKRIPMLPKIPNIPGSLPAPKIPKRISPVPINNTTNKNNAADENNDVKVDIDFNQFDGAERAIRMPTPRPAESSVNDANEISLGEEEEEAFEDENDMANVVIAIPLEPIENNNIEPDVDPVTMNIDFTQFDGPTTSNHMATPRPDKANGEGINAEEEEEAEDTDENEENEENATYNNTRKFTFTSPPVPRRTASTPSPSPTKCFKLSIPPSSDAENDFNTDTLTDNDDIQFYVPNESNLSTPRPGQSCVREAFKDAKRAANIDDEDEDFGDEAVVINASVPLVPQIDIENEIPPTTSDDLRPMRRSTPRPTHHKKVYEEELHSDSSDEENHNNQGAPISPSKNKPYRTKSMPPFKIKSAANYKLPLIPLNVLKNKESEAIPETEINVNTDPDTESTPKNGDAVVGCSSTPPNKKVVSSPPKSTHPSPAKIPLLNFGTLKDSNNNT